MSVRRNSMSVTSHSICRNMKAPSKAPDTNSELAGRREAAKSGEPEALIGLGYFLINNLPELEMHRGIERTMEELNLAISYSMEVSNQAFDGGAHDLVKEWDERMQHYVNRINSIRNDIATTLATRTSYFKEAFECFEKAAIKGDAEGMWLLGWRYYLGEGTTVNVPEAITWWKKAASYNHPSVAAHLKGLGVSLEEETNKGVFISYSHADHQWQKRLQVHLKPLEPHLNIVCWSDQKIQSGMKWQEEITKAIEKAGIAILLVSADFLASDFIRNNELPLILEAAAKNGMTVLTIILSPCHLRLHKNLTQFQSVNDPNDPVASMTKGRRDEVFAKTAERIEQIFFSRRS